MRLLKLELLNLFGIFNHSIDYDLDERVTLITAPNGYGKTITLKCIYNLFNEKFDFFLKLSFDKITFSFNNNKTIEIIKCENETIEFILKENDEEISSFEYPSKKSMLRIKRRPPPGLIDDFTPPYIIRIDKEQWANELTNEILSFENIIQQFRDYLPKEIIEKYDIEIPKDFSNILNTLEVYFIQEQRLVLRQPISEHRFRREIVITDTIEKYSNEIGILIQQKIGEYAQITQSLDSSFPKRLFQEKTGAKNSASLKERLNKLQEKRKKTSNYGLLKLDEDTFFKEQEIKESDAKVLSLYISDSEEKLSVFDSLVDQIEIFTKILNERRFNFKSIEIDKDKGFVFKAKNDLSLNLKPTELSSGEQHEVVLLFELLFKAKENSLVLIDEPEISLHVVWQKAFLNDIQEIIKLRRIDVVIATHSPQIINERWDLTVNLKASENE